MAVRYNIAEKPWVVTLRRGGVEIHAVFWAESKRALRDRLEAEFSQETEVLDIRER